MSTDDRFYGTKFLVVPWFPPPPATPEDTVAWSSRLTEAVTNALVELATRIDYFTTSVPSGESAQTASGLGNFYYDVVTGILYYDNGSWVRVGDSGAAADVIVTTTNFASWLQSTDDDIQTALESIDNIGQVTGEPNGFTTDAREDTEYAYSGPNRDFTLSLVAPATSADVYVAGKRVTITGDLSITLSADEGMHHIYVKQDGTLGETLTWTTDLLSTYAYVAAVYQRDTISDHEAIYIGDERHGVVMDWATHAWIHIHHGTQIVSGLTLGDITASASPNGNSDDKATMSVSSGAVRDEDLVHNIDTQSSPAQIPVLYKTGATPLWKRATTTNAPVVLATDRLYFNEYTGGAWQLTEVGSNNDFVLAHIFATNDIDQPIISIMGENEYTTRSNARDGALEELSQILYGDLPVEEIVPLASIIYKTNSGYSNTWHAAITTTEDGDDYVSWISNDTVSVGASPDSHPNLTNRDLENQHPDSSIRLSVAPTQLLSGAIDLDDVISTIDGWQNKGIGFDNNTAAVYSADFAGTGTISLVKGNAADQVEVGSDLIMPNAKYLLGYGKVAGYAYLIGLNSSDIVTVGSGSVGTNIISGGTMTLTPAGNAVDIGGEVQLPNTYGLSIKDSGGTLRNVADVNGSNELNIGSSSLSTIIDSDGTIDVGANDIDGTGDVQMDTRSSRYDNTLASGVGKGVFTITCPSDKTAGGKFHWHVRVTDASGNTQASMGYFTILGQNASGGTASSIVSYTEEENLVSTGTLAIAVFSSITTQLNCSFRVTTSLTSPTIELWLRGELGGDQPINWAI